MTERQTGDSDILWIYRDPGTQRIHALNGQEYWIVITVACTTSKGFLS